MCEHGFKRHQAIDAEAAGETLMYRKYILEMDGLDA